MMVCRLVLYALSLVAACAGQNDTSSANCELGLTGNDIAASSELDLTGKLALVTGGRSGLGYAISEALLRQNCTVVMASRNASGNEQAVADLKVAVPGANVSYRTFDLERLENVRTFASEFTGNHTRLDYYFGNAGQVRSHLALTVDGFEQVFQVNYVGQFLLVQLLLPLLRQTKPSRIILTGSSTHALACGTLGLSTGQGEDTCFSKPDEGGFSLLPMDQAGLDAVNNNFACPTINNTYPLTKYLMIHLAREISAREADNQVYAYSWAPGNIKTDLNYAGVCCIGPVEYLPDESGSDDPTCRYQLPYVGPTDAQGNPAPTWEVDFWALPPHGSKAAMYAALHATPEETGAFYPTYWECEDNKGYFQQGMTEEGRAQLYESSLEWGGLDSSAAVADDGEDESTTGVGEQGEEVTPEGEGQTSPGETYSAAVAGDGEDESTASVGEQGEEVTPEGEGETSPAEATPAETTPAEAESVPAENSASSSAAVGGCGGLSLGLAVIAGALMLCPV